jgi:hypothetical protein
MNSTGLLVLGGLLQGAGKGLADQYEERRQEALAALKRQYDVEDRDTKIAADAANTQAEIQGRKDIVSLTGDTNIKTEKVKGEEDRITAAARGEVEQQNIKLKGSIDLSNDTAIEKLKHDHNLDEITAKSLADTQHDLKLAHITPDHYEISANGQIIIYKKDGSAYVRGQSGDFVPKGSSDDTSFSGLLGNGEAAPAPKAAPGPVDAPAAPKANPNGNVKAQALARLPGLYAQAQQNPEQFRKQYPGMFDASGNLRPIEELKTQIENRYGE